MTYRCIGERGLGSALGALLLLLGSGTRLQAQTNVLLVVADDLGLDNVAVYAAHPDPARTPVIDQLAAEGMLFTDAYANPACSPTRATLLTGRYSWRTGLGTAISAPGTGELALAETTLPEILAPAGYRTAVVGKWHLSNDGMHPLQSGFEQHWGTISSIPDQNGLGNGYFEYIKHKNGVPILTTTYATTETVDDALRLIDFLGEPWFVMVAFNAIHVPFHKPPAALHSYRLPAEVVGNEPIHAKAMTQALDTEFGRLLDGIDRANTLVIFTSDNGPTPKAIAPPWKQEKAKGTLYEHGVNVPLIVSGPGVAAGTRCAALVNTTDLFATIAEVASVPAPTGVDSLSLVPYFADPQLASLRSTVYVERFVPNFPPALGPPAAGFARRARAARESRYKLYFDYLAFSPLVDPEERFLFDLRLDPDEEFNLLDQPLSPSAQQAYLDLQVALVAQGPSPWTDLGGALPGSFGVPNLSCSSSLVPQTSTTLEVAGGPPQSLAALVVGFSILGAPFAGGTLLPEPDFLVFLATDRAGALQVSAPWPPLPPRTPVTFQAWIADAGAPEGWCSTNALTGTSAP